MDQKTLKVFNKNAGLIANDQKSRAGETVAEYPYDEQKNRTQASDQIMEAIVEATNLEKAYKQVKRNKGSAGVDKMTVDELLDHLKLHGVQIKKQLLDGTYNPMPVRRVEIPKPDGGIRKLGIPTVLDRFIQQAVGQVLNQIYDSTFSESSFGFRPRRCAQDAIKQSKRYVEEGYKIVVDIDLEKFFDKVQHDVLMNKLKQRIKDARVLKLIRKYLKAGIMNDNNEVIEATEGTPQGGPLSPLLSNILLDYLDKELEKRGHKFCRYADDCNIYVKTQKSGERVMGSVTKLISEKLKLKVNKDKSAVSHVKNRKFLGYGIRMLKGGALIKPHKKSVEKFKLKVKSAMRSGRGQNIKRFINEVLNPILRGWHQYFKISTVTQVFKDLDEWIRRRIRMIYWRQLKNNKTRFKKMLACRINVERAKESSVNGRGPWWNSNKLHMSELLPTKTIKEMGLYVFTK